MDKFEGRTREKGWFYAVLDPRLFSTKNSLISIPSHDRYQLSINSPLIPLRSAKFISSLPLPFLVKRVNGRLDLARRAISNRSLFGLNEQASLDPATTFIPAIQFLFKRIRDKEGGRIVQRVSTRRREILGEGEPTFVGLST